MVPPHTHLIRLSPPVLSKLLSLHKALSHLAKAAPEVLPGAEVARALEQALTRVIIQCLSEGQGIEVAMLTGGTQLFCDDWKISLRRTSTVLCI